MMTTQRSDYNFLVRRNEDTERYRKQIFRVIPFLQSIHLIYRMMMNISNISVLEIPLLLQIF